MSWDGEQAAWWKGEVSTDPAYEGDVDPMLRELLPAHPTGFVIDAGCGDGRLLGVVPGVLGIDRSIDLARAAADVGAVAVADVAGMPFGDGAVAGVFAVLVVEHLAEPAPFFAEAARVVEKGGFLVVVINHPVYTAPGSGPFLDPVDREVLWRWGRYLEAGHSDEPAGSAWVRFHHRPLGALLTMAAAAGWSLEVLRERPLAPGSDEVLAAQLQVPRLAGVRWRRRTPHAVGPLD